MARIFIEPAKAKNVVGLESSLEDSLRSLGREVDGVRGKLRYKIAGEEAISARLREAAEQLTREAAATRACRTGLEQVIRRYEQTENANRERASSAEQTSTRQASDAGKQNDAPDKSTKTFDDDPNNGTYGADQGDMKNHKKGIPFLWFRFFEDEELFDFIKQHSRYKDYSNTQIADLMDQINNEGCGYVAIVNNIFVEYEGREEEFEQIFGFPMYDKNGKANYNYLLVDFYACTDDQYYLDESQGATALVNDVILEYLDGREEEFQKKYGCPPLLEGRRINPKARQAILDDYQNTSSTSMDTSGTTLYSLENRLQHYLNEKGVTCSVNPINGMPDNSQLKQYMDNGKNVNISVSDFNLYDEKGNAVYTDVGGHWMTVTGMTDDGRYIVSSWGERYYLNPSELNDVSFLVVDVTG